MFFDAVVEGKPDPIFGLIGAFQADPRPEKVNLLIGIYKDEHLKSSLMPSVKRAKEEILEQDLLADYLPFEGLKAFTEELGALVFGKEAWAQGRERIFSSQSVGGTGALRIGADFLAQEVSKKVFLSNPTWPNHHGVFERAGFSMGLYDYYSREKRGFDLEAVLKSLEKLPEKSVVLLHAGCHNPTGCDPTFEEWEQISTLLDRKKLIPFFDFAYQGFGDGLEEDARIVRLFYERGHEMLIAYSCAKNFSLYCQRVGGLFIVTRNSLAKERVASQVRRCIRTLYSNPPAHGARIVAVVLQRSSLRAEWAKELTAMRERISRARSLLIERLSKGGDFSYLEKHKGMFSFVDLNKTQVQKLIDEYAVYMIDNGRLSVAGLNEKNIDYVAESLLAVS